MFQVYTTTSAGEEGEKRSYSGGVVRKRNAGITYEREHLNDKDEAFRLNF